MSLKRPATALVLAALLAAPLLTTVPAIAAGAPSSRAECRLMDPDNSTEFCRKLHEIDLWRAQIMDETGPTSPEADPVLLHLYLL